ncbi:hypothetical protein D9M71_805460 [compost metagenome]
MLLKEIRIRCTLGEVNDATEVAEQRHFDQGAEQSDGEQGGKTRPDLLQVIGVEGQHAIRRGCRGGVAEHVDQLFETAIEHQITARSTGSPFIGVSGAGSGQRRSIRPVQLSR